MSKESMTVMFGGRSLTLFREDADSRVMALKERVAAMKKKRELLKAKAAAGAGGKGAAGGDKKKTAAKDKESK